MTIHIPLLDSYEAGPSTHRHVIPSSDAQNDLRDVVRCLRDSKRVVVVTGAGISTGADIPDFRSSTGLFRGDRGGVERTKDLFHVKCLSSPSLLAEHHALITSLASLAISANPTPFHSFLSSLSSSGRLLRCYTQNIDGLESKVGLKIGIPPAPKSRNRARARSRSQSKQVTENDMIDPQLTDHAQQTTNPEAEAEPEVIPLHGSIHTLSCTLCKSTFPILPYLPLSPLPIPCPTCELTSTIREALSERRRRKGSLRSDVILYGEEHPQGEMIGSSVERDLKNVDCLVVVGTSLNIPGVRRLVKEMSSAVHHKSKGKGKVILINDEYPKTLPVEGGKGKGIFDYWIEGDIKRFTVDYLTNQTYFDNLHLDEGRESGPSTPKKRKERDGVVFPPTPESIDRPRSRHRKEEVTPTERKRKRMEVEVVIPISPVSMKKRNYVNIRERETTPTPVAR